MEEGRGKVAEGMGGTGQNMGWDGSEGKGRRGMKEMGGLQPPNLNFWRRLCPVLLETLALYSYMTIENVDVTKKLEKEYFSI